jgi:hypothetical protein
MSIWKKITGIEKLERNKQERENEIAKLEEQFLRREADRREHIRQEEKAQAARKAETERLIKEEEIAKLSPKERATEKGEPWVDVLQTHINEDNIRNGFFELDWNDLFVETLRKTGYGTEADPEEEIVDRWFRDIVSQMLTDEGLDPTQRGSGYINVVPISRNKSEVS